MNNNLDRSDLHHRWGIPLVADLIGKDYHIEKQDDPNPSPGARCRKIRQHHLIETQAGAREVDR
ncbi:hypothetical protein [Halomonas alkalisoli]|uniref:hypothetical protein n=1 Tax=Halomonas alkalisoli TaxID=2907158 RepID=UPI001F2C8AB0|nr:hypothetical protein [Halomonas alkalisoli]MCE9681956.1 hypothetical protein [Halomonas alkalisoli]